MTLKEKFQAKFKEVSKDVKNKYDRYRVEQAIKSSGRKEQRRVEKQLYNDEVAKIRNEAKEEARNIKMAQIRERAIDRARNPPIKKFARALKSGGSAFIRGAGRATAKGLKYMKEESDKYTERQDRLAQSRPPRQYDEFGSGASDSLLGGMGADSDYGYGSGGGSAATDLLMGGGVGLNVGLGGIGLNLPRTGTKRKGKKGRTSYDDMRTWF